MKREAFTYGLKVWPTTGLIAPSLIILLRIIAAHKYFASSHSNASLIEKWYHKFLLSQLGFAAANLLVLIILGVGVYYTILWLDKRRTPFRSYKWILTIAGIILTLLPGVVLVCYAMADNISSFYNIRAFSSDCIFYIPAVTVSVWLYKIKPASAELKK
ncbi:MAG TPA: hypothetical protein VHE59_21960 [Mucilaginibacter sp.]|nr:hypothetical protein [Mucilaginibacter sp.]